ncbi:hypothetical protein Tco_0508174 [Tanacetum coccineum]
MHLMSICNVPNDVHVNVYVTSLHAYIYAYIYVPSFKDVPEKELFSDDESAKINEQANNLNNDEVENASEVVSDTYFGDNGEVQGFEQQHGESNDKEVSSDPFNIYNLLDKRTKEVRTTDTSTQHPLSSRSARSNSRVLEEAENSETSLSEAFLSFRLSSLDRSPLRPNAYFTQGSLFPGIALLHFAFNHSWLELPGFDDFSQNFGILLLLMIPNGLSQDLKSNCGDIDKVLDQKSHLLGVGIPDNCVAEAAKSIGCLIMKAPFKYLGILVGDNMSSKKAWDETINKMKKRLSSSSKQKINSLKVSKGVDLISQCRDSVWERYKYKLLEKIFDWSDNLLKLSFLVCMLLKRKKTNRLLKIRIRLSPLLSSSFREV